MTPEQALRILDQASGMAALTREQHARVQEAIDVLAAFIRNARALLKRNNNT